MTGMKKFWINLGFCCFRIILSECFISFSLLLPCFQQNLYLKTHEIHSYVGFYQRDLLGKRSMARVSWYLTPVLLALKFYFHIRVSWLVFMMSSWFCHAKKCSVYIVFLIEIYLNLVYFSWYSIVKKKKN